MSAVKEPRHRYTYDEYLSYERDAAMKHEFFDGEIYAMAGGSPRHSALALNIGSAVRAGRPRGCRAFQSDLKVRILATGRVTYPDVSMVCGPLDLDPNDPRRETVTNPTLLVEVLSRSTEDRITKRHDYQLIPSVREYVLVSQDLPRIEIYRRQGEGDWEYIDVGEGSVKLATGPTLDLADLYDDLPE